MTTAKQELAKLKVAEAEKNTVVLDKLSRSDYKSVRKEAQDALNKIDGIVDEKGKASTVPLDKEARVGPEKSVINDGWIDATKEELEQYQAEGRLVGHNPVTGQVKLN